MKIVVFVQEKRSGRTVREVTGWYLCIRVGMSNPACSRMVDFTKSIIKLRGG